MRGFRCGQVYHIFQRGNFRRNVFTSDEERAAYTNYLFARARHHHVRIHNFCLMRTHIHFVLEQTRRQGISRLMRDLQGLHSRKQNARLGNYGNLWTQHFGCKLVVSSEYYQALMWYVSNNPVRAGVISEPEKYLWSGAVALSRGGEHVVRVRNSAGELQPVPIKLWIERFQRECDPDQWAHFQVAPLPQALQSQIASIELILDGTARQYFANQERIRRLNQLREETKAQLSANSGRRKRKGFCPPARKAAGSASTEKRIPTKQVAGSS